MFQAKLRECYGILFLCKQDGIQWIFWHTTQKTEAAWPQKRLFPTTEVHGGTSKNACLDDICKHLYTLVFP
jgi:hypothetical protein